MTLISSMTVPALQDLIKKSFVKEAFRPEADVRRIYHKLTGDWISNKKRIVELDRDRFASQKVEGQASKQLGISEGYSKDITRKTISVTRLVSGEAYKALSAHNLSKYATQTAADVVDKIELDMRNFIGIIGTSYTDKDGYTIDTTTGDGQDVFDTGHTLKNVSTTYSNILSGAPALSESSLDSAADYFNYNVLDNNGQRISGMKPNTIITSEAATMKGRVARIFGSISPESIEGTANTNSGVKNTNRNKYKHLVVEFDVTALDIANSSLKFYWYIAALGGTPETSFQAYYISWLAPQVAPAEINQDKWTLSWTGRACYAIGASSAKGILVSKATS